MLNSKQLNSEHFRASPWDQQVFDIPCYEIINLNEQLLAEASSHAGHYSVKVDPLADKALLHHYGFYYADTLIEPYCTKKHFIAHRRHNISIDPDPLLLELLPICEHSFEYGRFHRDFNLCKQKADQRYQQWLGQLHEQGNVFGLRYDDRLVGFIAFNGGKLLLHAIKADCRGQGLAKHLWSAAIEILFEQGAHEIRSSISMANLAAVNLYTSLGFRFDNARDIYHRLTK